LRCWRIRQRLHESAAITLEATFNQARALELAKLWLASYLSPLNPTTTAAASSKAEKCFFCGNHHHPRTLCQAKEATCRLCSKKGRYQRVCKSSPNNSLQNSTAVIHMLASVSLIAPCCLQRSIVKGKLNGVELIALIDTDSSLSFINQSLIKKHAIKWGHFLAEFQSLTLVCFLKLKAIVKWT
jgi:hypothetical protein